MMRSFALGCGLALLAGCVKQGPPAPPPNESPVIPALHAPVYSVAPTDPKDHLVETMLVRLTEQLGARPAWDEALSGAAGSIAMELLDGNPTDEATVRWAAINAGWPYPISHIEAVATEENALPPESFGALLGGQSHVGMVRARGSAGEIWVALGSSPARLAAPFSKAWEVGDRFELPFSNIDGLTLSACGPEGPTRTTSPGERSVTLDHSGEWVVEARSEASGSVILRAALHVGEELPQTPPTSPREAPASASERGNEIASVVAEARSNFHEENLTVEPLLNSTAEATMVEWSVGGTIPGDMRFLNDLNITAPPRAELHCIASTPRACVDQLYWSAEHRDELLRSGYSGVGVAVSDDDQGLRAVIHLAAQ